MIPFLAESFRRLVFRHRINVVDDDFVEAERPDLVLTILTERFCTALPLDENAIPFEREIARKHKYNALLPCRQLTREGRHYYGRDFDHAGHARDDGRRAGTPFSRGIPRLRATAGPFART
jgi:hypothetical protein